MKAGGWFGTLPSKWEVKRADAVLDYLKTPARMADFADGQVFHYSIPAIQETGDGAIEDGAKIDSDKVSLRGGELLVSKLNPRKGCVLIAKPQALPIVCSTEFVPLVARPGFNSRFAFYVYTSTPVRELISSTVQSVTRSHQRASPEDISKIWLPIPPINEQRSIVSFLDQETIRLDDLVAEKESWLKLLAEKGRALITEAVTRGVNLKSPTKNSGVEWLGKIPTTWETRRVKYLFRLILESAPADHEFQLLSVYTDIGVRPRKELEARGNKASSTEAYWMVRPGDIIVNKLLAWMGAFGVSEYEGVTSPAYDILRPKSGADSTYYHYLFRCGICFTEFRRRSTGIMDMRLRLYFDKFGDMRVPFPPLDEQRAIVAYIGTATAKLDALRAATERTIALLKERRAALIAAAVTGKIQIPTKK